MTGTAFVVGHALDSIDWTQTHEWILLVLLIIGVFALVKWTVAATLWAARIIKARHAARAEARVSDTDVRVALMRIAEVLERLDKEGRP